MSSTAPGSSIPQSADWRSAGYRYYSRNYYCRKKFGCRVWKVSLDAQFSCPNRDGTLGTEGCIFCDPESFSPSRRTTRERAETGCDSRPIREQLDEGIRRLQIRHRVGRFVAYFQPATNTYLGPDCIVGQDSILPSMGRDSILPSSAEPPPSPSHAIARLRSIYEQALAHPAVVGMAIGTRPDCVPDPILDLLAELSQRTWLTVEYGLQTIHDRSLDWLNRGHHYGAFLDAFHRSRRRRLEIGVHVVLGLPGESHHDIRATARELARLRVDSIKLHNLYAVRGTRLAERVTAGEVRLPSLEEYVTCAVDCLEALPPTCVIDRISADAPPQYLVGPAWCLDRSSVRMAVEAEFARRGSWQGSQCAQP